MPESYRPHLQSDDAKAKTHSQSLSSNTAIGNAVIGDVLERKGKDVISIRPQETLGKAVEILRERNIGALLVTDANGALQGILSERDIVRKLADAPGKTLPQQVNEVMTKDVITCTGNDLVVSVMKTMTEGKFRHMPVMDDTGLTGMVTIGDLVNHRLVQLEFEAVKLKQLIVG